MCTTYERYRESTMAISISLQSRGGGEEKKQETFRCCFLKEGKEGKPKGRTQVYDDANPLPATRQPPPHVLSQEVLQLFRLFQKKVERKWSKRPTCELGKLGK